MIPELIPNWINGEERPAQSGEWFDKFDPTNGKLITRAARSEFRDIQAAIESAKIAFEKWSEIPGVQRGLFIHKLVDKLQEHGEEIVNVIALETGKSHKDARAETNGAIQCGLFFAGEGQRLYGRTTTSSISNRYVMTIRQPIGIAGLIIAANTPIANIAWKIFPAIVCGNAAILKASEDTPTTAWTVGKIIHEAGLPPGVLNIVQGYGGEAGAALVDHPDVGVISFTGSTEVGKFIQKTAGTRLARISLELGGKNSLIVCDDADLDNAVNWVLLSAFSNAGQRCASTSRVLIFDSIYDQFRDQLVERTGRLKVGPLDDDAFGPVINEEQLTKIITLIEASSKRGGNILAGGFRLSDAQHRDGYYIAPTLMDNVKPEDEISNCELFGPVAILYRVRDFQEAMALANDSPYGLTASIHTRSIHRALRFCDKVQAGVAVVNAGTYGSEPHMPFGGRKQSGNGSREPGTEALDVYSELKNLYINIDQTML